MRPHVEWNAARYGWNVRSLSEVAPKQQRYTGPEMSDRDDGGYNSPEGKEISEEVQRRKAALAQLTVDGGAAEENSDEIGAPKPFGKL